MNSLHLDYICTYKQITEDDESEEGLRELMYQMQYLQLFGLQKFDEAIINEKIESVYKQLEHESFLDELFEFHTYKGYMHKEFMFRTLFAYEYLDLFHKLLYNLKFLAIKFVLIIEIPEKICPKKFLLLLSFIEFKLKVSILLCPIFRKSSLLKSLLFILLSSSLL